MEDGERLRIVLKRLIEEMGYYDEEYDKWAGLARNARLDAAAGLMEKAQNSLRSGVTALREAMDTIP